MNFSALKGILGVSGLVLGGIVLWITNVPTNTFLGVMIATYLIYFGIQGIIQSLTDKKIRGASPRTAPATASVEGYSEPCPPIE